MASNKNDELESSSLVLSISSHRQQLQICGFSPQFAEAWHTATTHSPHENSLGFSLSALFETIFSEMSSKVI